MGVGTGKVGKVTVTDMDRIEVSNLSRQFLFRDSDVGTPKSVSGARVVRGWNPRMNVVALEKRVGTDSEDHFDDGFWDDLDVCWNALDNVLARRYTDSKCLLYGKPLLESGTLGTKCNHEVVLPFRTSSYSDGKESDENENQIAMCTLRSFPFLPLHCIEFAKQAYFSDYFEFGPDQYETFRKDREQFFEQLEGMETEERLKALNMIRFFVSLQQEENGSGTIDFASCVRIAFDRMMEDFRSSVLNLCHAADEMEKSDGKKFWTGTKRRPRAIDWNLEARDPELMEYLYCASNLYGTVWGLDPVRDRGDFEAVVLGLNLEQPMWSPSNQNIDLSDEDGGGAGDAGDKETNAEKIKADLYNVDTSSLLPARPHDFEKDDDSNYHVDFLTAATNLRSWNYDIRLSKRHDVKVTAGRIIPALATTTAMVCGLVDVEFCKLLLGLQNRGREHFLNSNVNLAAGSGNFTTFRPDPPIPIGTGLKAPYPEKFTSWDKVEVSAGPDEMTVQSLVHYLERTFGVTVDRVFEYGGREDRSIYDSVEREKLGWDVSFDSSGKLVVTGDIYSRWPNMRMAENMLKRLPPTSGQRKMFVGQVETVRKALEATKSTFVKRIEGTVSSAFMSTYEPSEDDGDDGPEKRKYFHAVHGKRDYVMLGVHCHVLDGMDGDGDDDGDGKTDIHLPPVKYIFRAADEGEMTGQPDLKRCRIEEN